MAALGGRQRLMPQLEALVHQLFARAFTDPKALQSVLLLLRLTDIANGEPTSGLPGNLDAQTIIDEFLTRKGVDKSPIDLAADNPHPSGPREKIDEKSIALLTHRTGDRNLTLGPLRVRSSIISVDIGQWAVSAELAFGSDVLRAKRGDEG